MLSACWELIQGSLLDSSLLAIEVVDELPGMFCVVLFRIALVSMKAPQILPATDRSHIGHNQTHLGLHD